MRAIAWSHLLSIFLTRTPSSRETQRWSNTASIGTIASSSLEISLRSASFSTPAVRAASSALGEIGSQPPNTMSSRPASGTNSRIIGLRFSSLVPRRMCAIWLIEPIGGWMPLRAAITPAMKVDATAPMPGVRTPSLPVAGAICRAVIRAMISHVSLRLPDCEASPMYISPGATTPRSLDSPTRVSRRRR